MLMASFFTIYKNVIVYTIIIVYNKLYYSFEKEKMTTGENKKRPQFMKSFGCRTMRAINIG